MRISSRIAAASARPSAPLLLALLAALLAALIPAPPVRAALTLNFSPNPAATPQAFATISCNMPNMPQVNCGTFVSSPMMGHPDPTPFLQELVDDGFGNVYYHVIVGLPDSGKGFAQEYYSLQSFGPSNGPQGSASYGYSDCFNSVFPYCNGEDPLGSRTRSNPGSTVSPMAVTGIGTGGAYTLNCPTCGNGVPWGKVAVRQLVGNFAPISVAHVPTANGAAGPNGQDWACNDVFCQEYFKTFGKKPRISQILDDGTVRSEFVADMSASAMLSMPTAPAPITNTLLLRDGSGAAVSSFDVTASAQTGSSTAGMYCRGTLPAGQSSGSCRAPDLPSGWQSVPTQQYSYFDGSMPLDQDWSIYRDPAQNP